MLFLRPDIITVREADHLLLVINMDEAAGGEKLEDLGDYGKPTRRVSVGSVCDIA